MSPDFSQGKLHAGLAQSTSSVALAWHTAMSNTPIMGNTAAAGGKSGLDMTVVHSVRTDVLPIATQVQLAEKYQVLNVVRIPSLVLLATEARSVRIKKSSNSCPASSSKSPNVAIVRASAQSGRCGGCRCDA